MSLPGRIGEQGTTRPLNSNAPKKRKAGIPLLTKDFPAFFLIRSHFLLSRGRGARTPIYGFGDRCSTIELFPYGLFHSCFI